MPPAARAILAEVAAAWRIPADQLLQNPGRGHTYHKRRLVLARHEAMRRIYFLNKHALQRGSKRTPYSSTHVAAMFGCHHATVLFAVHLPAAGKT